ncbi:MAG: diguanylate cyclase [Clostridia bacterium]|nr:diguanylate cyclase [Clostridia bacterium]
MIAMAVVISILLIHATTLVNASYSELRKTTDQYVMWQKDASDLQVGSDYLTEQVRCFAETGEIFYLEEYFKEANETKRRDKAVSHIHEFVGDTPAYQALVAAMGESITLMDREYYSMRLKIEACEYELDDFPEVIRNVALSEEDASLSFSEKSDKARSLVFNDYYHEKKVAITSNVQACLATLEDVFEDRQTATTARLNGILSFQRIMIGVSIAIVVAMLVVELLFIVRPLRQAISDIRSGDPLTPKGFREFRFLAETYNQIYESNLEQKQSITALLDNMPAMSFSKDVETGVYLACNQAFAEYANKENPNGVIGMTDAQLFDPVTAQQFVEDDRMAISMDEPYIFYENVPDAAGNLRQLQTTKLKFADPNGRLCLLGMCADVTDMARISRENTTNKEVYEKARSMSIMYSHFAKTLARNFMDLYYINLNNDEFIEYLPDSENGTLLETRRGGKFFDQCKHDAKLYVHPDDQPVFLAALERESLVKSLRDNKTFMITYRVIGYHPYESDGPIYVSMKASRMADDENFVILAVADVDEQIKERRAAERMQEERIAYSRINALTGDFLCVYVVSPDTERYIEYSAAADYKSFEIPKEGTDFFATSRENGKVFVHPEDLDKYLTLFTKERVLSSIEKKGIFVLNYRLFVDGKPTYVQLKAAMVKEKDGPLLVVGINDVDSHVRQEQEYEKRIARAQSEANIDALTGVKNKHAYMEAEMRLDRQIDDNQIREFAVVIMDVNDLKKINDSEGHNAGDKYIRDACKIICGIFAHSPVFRVGGDEFAIIAQGSDYASIDELIGKMREHNNEALKNNGVVIACGMSKFKDDSCVAAVFERADQNMYENKSFLKGN